MKTAREAKKEIGRLIARYQLNEIGTIEVARLVEREIELIEHDAYRAGMLRAAEIVMAEPTNRERFATQSGRDLHHKYNILTAANNLKPEDLK